MTLQEINLRNQKIGEERGYKKGVEAGKIEAKLEDCQRMLAMNMSFEQISIITGLSGDQIHQLANQKS